MVLEAKGLTKYYGKKPALVDCSYDFHPGIYGLLGPNGAGKSTLMGIMTTNLKATAGELFLDGRDIRAMGRRPWEQVAVARGLAIYNPQTDKTVEDILERAKKAMADNKEQQKKML